MKHPRPSRRALAATTLAAGLVLATGLPAAAHVTVSSPDAAAGGYAKLVLRVPNESETATTTSVTVTLPEDAPFASVRTLATPGWTATLTDRTFPEPVEVGDLRLSKAVGTVTWTAEDGAGIPPDEFGELALSVGPLPEDAGDLSFPVRQTYSDGEVSDWSQPTPASGEEPEYPAPVLTVGADGATGGAHGAHGGAATSETSVTEASTTGTSLGTPATLALWAGPVGLVLGLVALGLVLAGRRTGSGSERV
ncbi:YcnI family protein [Solicola sp. PLA-1-18]|uniref:YcnI family copper-binding membrane protein n=1 Tax=Solicola sp. PLA-1-18 TaxID=3380532 RepID=UPI003B7ABE25